VYVPVESASFFQLDPRTPMVYLNFATVYHLDTLFATDHRRPLSLIHATHGATKSLYVLCPTAWRGGQGVEPPARERYLVPSAALATPSLQAYNARLVKTGHLSDGLVQERKLDFADGELIDTYATTHDGVAEVLHQLFTQAVSTATLLVGDRRRGYRHNLVLADYIVNKATVVEEMMEVWNGKSFWGLKRALLQDDTGDSERAVIGFGGNVAGPAGRS
jgi:hypothetical protein